MLPLEVEYFKPVVVELGPVRLEAYERVKTEKIKLDYLSESEAVDKVYDILVNVVERYRSDKEPRLIEVRARVKQGEIVAATLTKSMSQTAGVLLFPRPVKLLRLGVKEESKPLIWFTPEKDLYVFHGRISLPETVEYIVLDTEEGLRVLTRNEVTDVEEERKRERKTRTSKRRRRRG